jgi:phage host-nuclease inhibitor protein Gam
MITKELIEDKIEIVGDYKAVQIRTSTVIKENDIEISRSYNRHVVNCLDDISGESTEVQAICNAVWTDELKADYQAHLDSQNIIEE